MHQLRRRLAPVASTALESAVFDFEIASAQAAMILSCDARTTTKCFVTSLSTINRIASFSKSRNAADFFSELGGLLIHRGL